MDCGNRSAQTRLIARCGLLCALGALCLMASNLPWGKLACYALASLMLLPPLCVNRPIWALVTALATGILGFLIIGPIHIVPYAAFFAPFLLVKYAIEDRLPGRAGSVARPLVYALWSAGLIALGLTLAPETLGEFGGWLFWLTPAGVLLCYLWNAILTSLIMGFGPKMRRLMT